MSISEGITELGDYLFSLAKVDTLILPVSLKTVGRMSVSVETVKRILYYGDQKQYSRIREADYGKLSDLPGGIPVFYYSETDPIK